MSLPDFNIAKFEIPVSIKKALNKGKIADSYKEMYLVADELATVDSTRFQILKTMEYKDAIRQNANTESITEILVKVEHYKNERLDYHMQNMIRLLEIYAAGQQEK